jgi:hypothetical protein
MADEYRSRFVVVLQDPSKGIDSLAIGVFEDRQTAQTEAHHWRESEPGVRAMVRYLWDGDDLRRDMAEAQAKA